MRFSIHFLFIYFICCIATSSFAQCMSGDCTNGRGIYMFPSGSQYIGTFLNGEVHGKGTCLYKDGSKYEGEWSFRFPDGYGTKTYPDGTIREGYWKKGKAIKENGAWIEEEFTAKGQIHHIDIQSGCILGNCQEGRATFAYADGSKYEGEFVQGRLEGHGTWHYPNGDRYIGMFKNNFVDGIGTLYKIDGTITSGNWSKGEFIGERFTAKGESGCINGNCFNGKGTYVYSSGFAKYVGHFINGRPDGEGVCYFSNGERYTGEWSKGKFNGLGTLFLQDGSQVEGYWTNGAFQAKKTSQPNNYTHQKPKPTPTPKKNSTSKNQNDTDTPNLKVWALIIGVASYEHMPTLRYTDDDAYRMYAFLKSPEGGALPDEQIRILIDENATKENILHQMETIFNQAGSNDLVLLYFSGHGLKGSFLPIDFDGYNNKIFHTEITRILENSPAKYKLCIADACHSGSLFSAKGSVQNTLLSYYENLAKAKSGTALIMSSKSEENSLESSGLRQGVFSHFLIRGLKGEADRNEDNIINIQELFHFISLNVQEYTVKSQSPVIQGDYDKNMTVSVKNNR